MRRSAIPCIRPPGGSSRSTALAARATWRGTYIIGMDEYNLRNMARICGGDPEGKLYMLMSFTGSDAIVDDPWYTGRFAEVYGQIDAGCEALLKEIVETRL